MKLWEEKSNNGEKWEQTGKKGIKGNKQGHLRLCVE